MRGLLANVRAGGWWAWAAVVLLVLIGAAPVLTYPLGRDQGEFAIIGLGILRGSIPYVDLWNPKPPAIFYTYAAAISAFGQGTVGLRALDLIFFVPMAASLYAMGRRLDGNAVGLWAVGLFGVFYFTESFWTLTQNDGLAALPMTLAVLCAFLALDHADGGRRVLFAGLAGALSALALWFKYPFITFVIALLVGYLSVRRRFDWREALAFVGGGLVVGLGGMAYMASIGAFTAWIESATVTAGYTAQGYDWATFWADMRRYAGFRWAQWHALWVIGLGGFLGIWRVLPSKNGGNAPESANRLVTDRRRWRIIRAWLIGSAIAMLIQAKGYDYHWLPMLPPLALLGAGTLARLVGGIQNSLTRNQLPTFWATGTSALAAILLAALLVVQTWGIALPYLMGQQSQMDYYAQFTGGEFVADESLAVAVYLREHVPPEDTLFIWGFRPEVYYLSRLRPASRFIFQFPLIATWYPQAWQQQTVDTLWASLPPFVLVVRGDYMPWVTGRDADSNTLLQEYTELNNWLIYNYQPVTEIGNFLVWQRKP